MPKEREKFASRLGFILISAGCAIGLGNVWRFPYITGKYGGAAFVLVYLLFLLLFGLPIMVMEFAVGRASQRSAARSFHLLEPAGTKWHWYSPGAMAGNYLLMMFYTTVGGWMIAYFFKMLAGEFKGIDPQQVGGVFNGMLAQPGYQVFWMLVTVVLGFGVCSMGLQKGVERVTKVMMACLYIIMLILCVRSVTLPGASEGLKFYLLPDFGKMVESGLGEAIYAAMGQAFFTLSLGIGALAIFGSYIGRDRRLTGEAVDVAVLDTTVALLAGLIIFPAIWGALFFLFMSFAALTTVIAVFENIISFAMDLWGWTRKKAVLVNGVLIALLSLPCALGFNVFSNFHPLGGTTTIQDLEDFLVSNNLLPLSSLVYLLFCVSRYGWGWDKFVAEADAGEGMRFPRKLRFYFTWILPFLVLAVFVVGYWDKFFKAA